MQIGHSPIPGDLSMYRIWSVTSCSLNKARLKLIGVGEERIPPWYVICSFEDGQIDFFTVNTIHATEMTHEADEKSVCSFTGIVDRNIELWM